MILHERGVESETEGIRLGPVHRHHQYQVFYTAPPRVGDIEGAFLPGRLELPRVGMDRIGALSAKPARPTWGEGPQCLGNCGVGQNGVRRLCWPRPGNPPARWEIIGPTDGSAIAARWRG